MRSDEKRECVSIVGICIFPPSAYLLCAPSYTTIHQLHSFCSLLAKTLMWLVNMFCFYKTVLFLYGAFSLYPPYKRTYIHTYIFMFNTYVLMYIQWLWQYCGLVSVDVDCYSCCVCVYMYTYDRNDECCSK